MPISFSGAWANLHCWQQCMRISVAQCPPPEHGFVGLLLLKGYFSMILICVPWLIMSWYVSYIFCLLVFSLYSRATVFFLFFFLFFPILLEFSSLVGKESLLGMSHISSQVHIPLSSSGAKASILLNFSNSFFAVCIFLTCFFKLNFVLPTNH